MAKRRRKKRWTASRGGKAAFCRTLKATNCTVSIGGRRYKARKGASGWRDCPTGKVMVCPYRRGRKTSYRISRPNGKTIPLHKMAKRRRRRRR